MLLNTMIEFCLICNAYSVNFVTFKRINEMLKLKSHGHKYYTCDVRSLYNFTLISACPLI